MALGKRQVKTRYMIKELKLPELSELTFDAPTHTYKLDGLVIPSVSTIMEPLKVELYKGICDSTLKDAADKGTIVHNVIENWIKFGINDTPHEYRGYFDGFLEFWNKNEPHVIGSELRIYHKLLRYGGTIDLLAYIEDKLTLIDFKSTYTVSDMTCGVQLEAYAQALASHNIKVERKMILQLKKDGKEKKIEYPVNDPQRWRVFGSLKTMYDYIHS